jgi:dUTP pyrophosphatase
MPEIEIIQSSQHPLPSYQTEGASGMDLIANLTDTVVLEPMQRIMIPTGISIAIPAGYEAQIRPRSGLAIKQGITCLNTPGTIDSDYRGEIQVILINLSNEKQSIRNGDRIAQMVIAKYEKAIWKPVEKLPLSQRGDGGFGSTGTS